MLWLVETGILLVVAVVLRRMLHMGRPAAHQSAAPQFRKAGYNPLYSPLASEIETHTAILGILLNDAIEEQNSGHAGAARRTLSVFHSERERLVELIVDLQNLALKYLPVAQYPIDGRSLNARSFRSQLVSEFVRRHGILDQFVFRSKLRFQLHLRLLRRATALLNESFEEVSRDSGTNARMFGWVLNQLDLYFHDLDLLTKETLLGFKEELSCLPKAAWEDMAGELATLTRHSVRNPVATPAQR